MVNYGNCSERFVAHICKVIHRLELTLECIFFRNWPVGNGWEVTFSRAKTAIFNASGSMCLKCWAWRDEKFCIYLVVYKHKEMSVGMTVQFRYKFRETFTGLLHNPLLILLWKIARVHSVKNRWIVMCLNPRSSIIEGI